MNPLGACVDCLFHQQGTGFTLPRASGSGVSALLLDLFWGFFSLLLAENTPGLQPRFVSSLVLFTLLLVRFPLKLHVLMCRCSTEERIFVLSWESAAVEKIRGGWAGLRVLIFWPAVML